MDDVNAAMGRLAQALEAVYRDRYGPVAARYIVECIAEGKDWSDAVMVPAPWQNDKAYLSDELVMQQITKAATE